MRVKKMIWMTLCIGILIVGCQTEKPEFYVHREMDFELLPFQNPAATYFAEIKNIPNTFPEEFELLGLQESQISAIYSGKGTFRPVYTDFDFGNIEEVSIWLVSTDDPSLRREIYYRDQIPLSQKNELRLLSGLADLKSFLLGVPKYNLEIQLNFRTFVPQNTDVRFTYSFAIFTN